MIINNSPQNQAVLSNVGQVGEFRIRNSAKAFNILSSGLYANKIRAIIRELSCNAVDSHVAAGKDKTPFDVHLPNTLEPWFSIRDYGTGLNNEQVTNIYTTYFESTKTDSNEFIGALGLGSKSPFSYTDNFTVTAIQGNKKGIYTAFINEQGVPSIALMSESETTEPNGVEVKFSVNERYDFQKFITESVNVYKYFKLRPVIHGVNSFKFEDPEYVDNNIIKGIHSTGRGHSLAIMGNIAYPIDIPSSDTTLGTLAGLLSCGLVIEFDIGELDFQASREGLSYIPSTINSIKNKLEILNNALYDKLKSEADTYTNYWDKVSYLTSRYSQSLWRPASIQYVTANKLPYAAGNNYGRLFEDIKFSETELASKYNIKIQCFEHNRGQSKQTNIKLRSNHNSVTKQYESGYYIPISANTKFVVTDTKRGAYSRAKQHWKNNQPNEYVNQVFVIAKADKTKAFNVAQFLKDIHSPKNVVNASQLDSTNSIRSGSSGKASILKLEERRRGRRGTTYAWANSGTVADTDDNQTYYYVQMDHWTMVGVPYNDAGAFIDTLIKSGLWSDELYGVRKADIESVRSRSNWIEINSFIKDKLNKMDMTQVMGLVKEAIDFRSVFKYYDVSINDDSPYAQLYKELKDVQAVDSSKQYYLQNLLKSYNIVKATVDPTTLIEQYKKRVSDLYVRYPLLKHVGYYAVARDIADYINMVDKFKESK